MMQDQLPAHDAPREPLHRRRIECTGYRRSDGLWEIEAELVDTRTFPSATGDRPQIAPGEPLHHFQLRVTLAEDLLIQSAEARTLYGPAHTCPEISSAYRRLAGLRIGAGFLSEARARFRGVTGCTHLTELLGPLATTALQTVAPHMDVIERAQRSAWPPGEPMPRPVLLDSCHSYRSDGPAVKRRYPEAYTGA